MISLQQGIYFSISQYTYIPNEVGFCLRVHDYSSCGQSSVLYESSMTNMRKMIYSTDCNMFLQSFSNPHPTKPFLYILN